jgi:DNA-binding HxlR family transcriptional regulator
MPPRPAAPATARLSCPSAATIRLISSKWSVEILFRLAARGVVRFRELQRDLGAVTQKELTRHLRQLESRGLVAREVFAEVPPRVEYRLTGLGESLLPPLEALARWDLAYQIERRTRRLSDPAPDPT